MAKWVNKEIKDLTDEELLSANKAIIDMAEFRDKQKNNPKYKQRYENKSEPEINPQYLAVKVEIETEINNRKLV